MEQNRQGQGSSGSAENRGQGRNEQRHREMGSDVSRQDVRDALDRDASRLSSLQDTGALSGRDDLAGGTGDGMQDQDSGQRTDR